MAAENIQVVLEYQQRNAQLIGQATQEVRAYGEEVKRLKAINDQSVQGQEALGAAVQRYIGGQTQLRAAVVQGAQAHQAFTQAVQGATQALAQQAGPLGGLVQALSGVNLVAAGVVGAVAAIGVGFIEAAKHTADYALELRNAAAVSGLAENTLAALRLGAKEAGKDFGDLQQGLFKFSRTLGEAVADPTSAAAKMFQSLGVAITDVGGTARSEEDVFRDVAKRIESTGDASAKARIAFEAFGRGGAAFSLVLQNGLADLEAQTRKMGTALSPDAERQALAFHAAAVKVQESINGLNLAFGGTAAGPLTDFNNDLATGIQRLTRFVDITKQFDQALKNKFARNAPGVPTDTGVQFGPAVPSPQQFGPLPSASLLKALQDATDEEEKRKKAIEDQYKATLATISLDKQRLSWGALSLDAEIKALEAMEGQVRSKRELTVIQKELNALEIGTSDRPYGPADPRNRLDLRNLKPVDTTLGAQANLNQIVAPKLTLPTDLNPELTKFLAQFEDFTSILKVAGDGTTGASQAMIGFIGELRLARGTALDFGRQMATTVKTAFEGFIHTAITGTQSLTQAFGAMIAQIAEQMIEKAFVTAALGLIPGVGPVAGAIVGGVSNAQGGGTFRAQSGIIVSGHRGYDTVPVMGGRGLAGKDEMILSHADTDFFRATMQKLAKALDTSSIGQPAASATTIAPEIHVHGTFIDRNAIQSFASEHLVPIIVDTLNRGSYRGR